MNDRMLHLRLRWNKLRHRSRKGARELKYGGCWGSHVSSDGTNQQFWSFPFRVFGHMEPRPQTGDVVIADMESGRKVRGTLEVTQYCRDPADMFFGHIHWLG